MAGDCYEANFKKFFYDKRNQDEFVLVHAMREIHDEWWGGHGFILDKKNNIVHDYSNGKYKTGTKEEIYKEWNIQEDGNQMYFEYSMHESVTKAYNEETYGPWELKFEQWMDDDHIDYMKSYFLPNFQPRLEKFHKEQDNKNKQGI
tara:strand:- start:883 stop:1320 length:438 start_codon:yes stop_codon:yes gene_type:complete